MEESAPASPTLPAAAARPRGLMIALYIGVVFLYWVSLYLYVPTLPMYVQSKTPDLSMIGVVISMYGLWQAAVRFPLGVISDWLGRRRPFIFAGLLLAALGAWIMGRATGATGLVVGRSVTGLAAGAWVPLAAAFNSLFAPGEAVRASAIISAASSLGCIAGSSVTGTLNGAGGYSLAFWVAIGVAGLGMLVAWPVRETLRPGPRPSLASVGRLIIRPEVLLPALLSALAQYVNFATTFGFLPILARQLGVSDVFQSLLTSLNLGILTLGNLAVVAVVNRIGARRMLYLSFALLFVGLGLAALAVSPAYVIAAQLCLGLGLGIGGPVLMGMSVRHVAEGERTTAMGLYQAVYGVGMFAGPWLSGLLAGWLGIQPMFGLTAVVCLAVGWLGASRLRAEAAL